MERLVMDLRTALARVRPWCLRVDALLRVGALAVSARMLISGGWIGAAVGLWLTLSAVGLWWRRVWAWQVSLLGDIAIVVGGAMMLVESENLQLFGTIAGIAVVDVVLLGLGQSALETPAPPPPPNAPSPEP
jgi:hypothetical protein